MGISKCDHILMILGVCLNMSPEEQEISTREMIKGFNDKAIEGGTVITGGQTVFNEYPMIGGVANVVLSPNEFIIPKYGRAGDVLILTKPLGSRVAVNLHQWMRLKNEKWQKAKQFISEEETQRAFDICCAEMSSLNKFGAELMRKYKCHGGTDVTGFGILGHAKNLAEAQVESLDLRLHSLPIIQRMAYMQDKVTNFKLMQGYTAETSGGLLMMISPEYVDPLLREFKEKQQFEAWIIGDVIKGERKAYIDEKCKIIEVEQITQTVK
eukprot:TRINITY_DN1382_c0_g1_i1.p1 TRINITY_DN1382_c0_g1~~TRINITY_DN1382_c0_g1_i1.p1  ORF type:complete len:268 (-),score=43.73 TRINITY_DN1382_c0_g1_i1:73-876(-)